MLEGQGRIQEFETKASCSRGKRARQSIPSQMHLVGSDRVFLDAEQREVGGRANWADAVFKFDADQLVRLNRILPQAPDKAVRGPPDRSRLHLDGLRRHGRCRRTRGRPPPSPELPSCRRRGLWREISVTSGRFDQPASQTWPAGGTQLLLRMARVPLLPSNGHQNKCEPNSPVTPSLSGAEISTHGLSVNSEDFRLS